MKKSLVFRTAIVLTLIATAAQGAYVTPDGIMETLGIVFYKEDGAATLPAPGDYEWWYGCSPTAAGMLLGYYDVHGYNGRAYDNLVPGGDAENHTYGSGLYLANNAIASSGHINDFYSGLSPFAGFGLKGDDVATPTHNFDCLADFMGTSQDSYNNSNGSAKFYFLNDGFPFTYSNVAVLEDYTDKSGMYGIGYDAATSTVFLHDTWPLGQHSMTWGGSYDGMEPLWCYRSDNSSQAGNYYDAIYGFIGLYKK